MTLNLGAVAAPHEVRERAAKIQAVVGLERLVPSADGMRRYRDNYTAPIPSSKGTATPNRRVFATPGGVNVLDDASRDKLGMESEIERYLQDHHKPGHILRGTASAADRAAAKLMEQQRRLWQEQMAQDGYHVEGADATAALAATSASLKRQTHRSGAGAAASSALQPAATPPPRGFVALSSRINDDVAGGVMTPPPRPASAASIIRPSGPAAADAAWAADQKAKFKDKQRRRLNSTRPQTHTGLHTTAFGKMTCASAPTPAILVTSQSPLAHAMHDNAAVAPSVVGGEVSGAPSPLAAAASTPPSTPHHHRPGLFVAATPSVAYNPHSHSRYVSFTPSLSRSQRPASAAAAIAGKVPRAAAAATPSFALTAEQRRDVAVRVSDLASAARQRRMDEAATESQRAALDVAQLRQLMDDSAAWSVDLYGRRAESGGATLSRPFM
jgi:hypothetical protein